MKDKFEMKDGAEATLIRRALLAEALGLKGRFVAQCFDKHGKLKWEETIENLVTTVGKNLALDTILGNSAAGAVVMGLKGTGSAAAGDTQASHAGWLEVGAVNAPAYTAPRKTPSFSAAAAGSKTTSAVVAFTFTSGGTVAGAFINIGGSSVIDNTTGTLFSAGDFAASKTVATNDVLNVTYTLTA